MVLKLVLRFLPWLLILILGIWIWLQKSDFLFEREAGKTETIQSVLLRETEAMGKIELVKYRMQQITEIHQARDQLKIFGIPVPHPFLTDTRAGLIGAGEAVGCIDLTQLSEEDLVTLNDTLYVRLPAPEMCYYKLDLDKSRLYEFQNNYAPEEKTRMLVDSLYRKAERQIRTSALEMGILEETRMQAQTLLLPLFRNISSKEVVITFDLEQQIGHEK